MLNQQTPNETAQQYLAKYLVGGSPTPLPAADNVGHSKLICLPAGVDASQLADELNAEEQQKPPRVNGLRIVYVPYSHPVGQPFTSHLAELPRVAFLGDWQTTPAT